MICVFDRVDIASARRGAIPFFDPATANCSDNSSTASTSKTCENSMGSSRSLTSSVDCSSKGAIAEESENQAAVAQPKQPQHEKKESGKGDAGVPKAKREVRAKHKISWKVLGTKRLSKLAAISHKLKTSKRP